MKRRTKFTGKTGIKRLSCITAAFVTVAMTGAGIVPVYATVKEETVYVVTDNSGAAKDTIVSDHLLNGDKSNKITDLSNLTNIENVKGNETFSKGKNNTLIWDAGGEDIYYQGRSNKALPVACLLYTSKSDYAYHTEAMDRAMKAGIDDVGCGVLFGLNLYKYCLLYTSRRV